MEALFDQSYVDFCCNAACGLGVIYLVLGISHYRRRVSEHRAHLTIVSAALTIAASLLVKHSPYSAFHVIYNINCATGVAFSILGAVLTLLSCTVDGDDPVHIVRFGACTCAVSGFAKFVIHIAEYSFS